MITVKDNRPVFLDLTKIGQPVPALVSITHRISGILIFLGLPILLWMLHCSLGSPESFEQLTNSLANPLVKLILWGLLAALTFHLFAGLRHMIMDMGIGGSLRGGRLSAKLVFATSAVVILLIGVWIW